MWGIIPNSLNYMGDCVGFYSKIFSLVTLKHIGCPNCMSPNLDVMPMHLCDRVLLYAYVVPHT